MSKRGLSTLEHDTNHSNSHKGLLEQFFCFSYLFKFIYSFLTKEVHAPCKFSVNLVIHKLTHSTRIEP